LGSKAKVSEWWNFGGERLLGAVKCDEPKERVLIEKFKIRTLQKNEACGTRPGLSLTISLYFRL